jgi:hypothetical protein
MRVYTSNLKTHGFPRDLKDSELDPDGRAWKDMAWRNFFRSHGLRSREYTFHHSILTDGIAVTALFTRSRRENERPKPKAGFGVSKEVREKVVAETLARKREVLAQQPAPRHIFIDPGRNRLITAMEVVDGGTERWWVLTRRQYYSSFQHGTARLQRLNAKLQHVDNSFAETSRKGTFDDLINHCMVYHQHYGMLWSVRACARYARVTLYVFTRKRRCLDRFFASFCFPTPHDFKNKTNRLARPVVWYGAGSFSSHTRGADGMAVPVKYIHEACKQHYTTLPVTEAYTSQMHSVCQRRMAAVRTDRYRRGSYGPETAKEYGKRGVRGLYWCGTCGYLVNRDRDACRSIGHAAMAMVRPVYLTTVGAGAKPGPRTCLPGRY